MIITISGKPGSGKSTLAKELAKKYKLKHYSAGDFMRELAKERNMSILELTKRAETDKSIDKAIDERTKKIGRESDNFVIDSRLAWHFIPHAIKIFLDISLEECARRIYNDTIKDLRPDERENTSIKKTMQNLKTRQESEEKRYYKLYKVKYLDKKNYDIVIDTTPNKKEDTFKQTVKEIEKILAKKKN